jgi:hypothetical protein
MNLGRRQRDTPSERDLAAFADGSMPAAQRARVERALSASPQLRASVAAQQRALSAMEIAARERAPSSLRARVSLVQRPARRRSAGGRGVVLASSAVVAGGAAVVAVVISLGGGTVAPTVAQAATLTGLAPQAAVKEPGRDRGILPNVRAVGLTYPYWKDRFGYRAVGVRYDRLGGRRITTVFYAHRSSRVAYVIVSGSPLPIGAHAWNTERQGVKIWVTTSGTGMVVSWLRDGHTCILTGAGTQLPALLRLVAWHEGGRIPY